MGDECDADEDAINEQRLEEGERQRWNSMEVEDHHLANLQIHRQSSLQVDAEAAELRQSQQQQQYRDSQGQQQQCRDNRCSQRSDTAGPLHAPETQEDLFEQAVAEIRDQVTPQATSSTKGHQHAAAAAGKVASTGKQKPTSSQGTNKCKTPAGVQERSVSRDKSQGRERGVSRERAAQDQGVSAGSSRRSAVEEEEEPEAFYVYPSNIPAEVRAFDFAHTVGLGYDVQMVGFIVWLFQLLFNYPPLPA